MKVFLITFFAAIVFILPGSLTATTYYVNPGERIQDAIDGSINGDTIIVRAGTYTGVGNRDLDFSNGLPEGQTRAITLESESGADVTIIDCQGTELDPHRGFYFHSWEAFDSVVDGFTITKGYVSGDWPDNSGGGIYCYDSSPEITNCAISGNSTEWGGGISCYYSSSPTITNCTISDNLSRNCGVNGGGGIYCYDNSSPTITNCTISDNSVYYGGGIFCDESDPTITSCTISGNSAGYGGGIYCYNSSPALTNCTITGNSSGDHGGGILCLYSSPAVTNCILWDNAAPTGHEIFLLNSSTLTLRYSDVQGGSDEAYVESGCTLDLDGTNIDADPLLTPDLHLMQGSPCIDAGTSDDAPATDIDGESRWDDPSVANTGGGSMPYFDIGVDEFVDTDGDGMPDWWEAEYYSDPGGDPDSDSLTNLGEYENGTDPENPDSDDDGWEDGTEITDGTNPLHPDNAEKTYYVNNATGDDSYDGLSPAWVSGARGPKLTIQAGIDATLTGWDYTVLVADGIYAGSGNRDMEFDGKAITLRSENGADVTIIDCEGTGRGFYFYCNETSAAVVDGFTITNGSEYSGGGILCCFSSPTIANCTISGNSSERGGGGICCCGRSSPTITNCTISNNYVASDDYDCSGGGICCSGSSPTITNCTITDNSANDDGGGLYCSGGNPTITNCTINGNDAGTDGGGIYCSYSSSPTITNCTVSDNEARHDGGGIHCYYDSSPTITNCTISGNSADDDGGGIYCSYSNRPTMRNCTISNNWANDDGGGIYCGRYSRPTMTDCILWGNAAPTGHEIFVCSTYFPSTLTVRYSDVQGGEVEAYVDPGCTLNMDGTNIDADPLFVGAGYNDFHLLPLSSCVDAGDPASDYSNEPLPNGYRINMGAYGNTAEATPSPGDVDGDLDIDMDDLILVYDTLGSGLYDPALDIDGDGAITFADLRIVHRHMCPSEQYVGGISTLWVLDYMEPTDPAVEGLNPYEDQSQMDNDGDGKTNYEEYIAGTDPTDASSLFEITEVSLWPTLDICSIHISWTVVPEKSYCLYCSEMLGEYAEWLPVEGDYEISDGIATQVLDVDINEKKLYFKVEVW